MGNREEFEKLATKTGFDILKDAFGDYVFPGTSSAWVTWQARQPEIDALNSLHFEALKEVNAERAKSTAKDKVIDELALQKGILKAEIGRIESGNESLKDRLRVLKSEVARLRKDADRYRWLRAESDRDYVEIRDVWHESADDLDDFIDTAMKETK